MQQPQNPYPQYPQQQWQQPSQPLPPQEQWQQQPNYAQPQAYYSPQTQFPSQQEWLQPPQQNRPQEPQKPPTKPPARRRWTWLWLLIALVVGIFIGYAVHVPSSQSTPGNTTPTTQNTVLLTSQPTQVVTPTQAPVTPTPTHTPKWTTVQTITGNGTKKTSIFTVPNDWKISWTCNPNSFYGGQYNMQVFVYGSDGSLVDLAVNTICKAGNTSDSTEEHQGGQVYLDINSEAAWTIQVQELK